MTRPVRKSKGSPRRSTAPALRDPEARGDARDRLSRAGGQLQAVVRMLDEGADCEQIIIQLAAVNKAVSAAAFTVISAGLEECLSVKSRDSRQSVERLQKLFLSLN